MSQTKFAIQVGQHFLNSKGERDIHSAAKIFDNKPDARYFIKDNGMGHIVPSHPEFPLITQVS